MTSTTPDEHAEGPKASRRTRTLIIASVIAVVAAWVAIAGGIAATQQKAQPLPVTPVQPNGPPATTVDDGHDEHLGSEGPSQ
jgi:hypothetical protein